MTLTEEQAKYNAEEKAKWKAIRRKDFHERTGSWSPVSHYVELWACLGIPIVTKLLGWW